MTMNDPVADLALLRRAINWMERKKIRAEQWQVLCRQSRLHPADALLLLFNEALGAAQCLQYHALRQPPP
jgi:hypothetical protein